MRLGRLSKLTVKAHWKFVCQDFSSSQPILNINVRLCYLANTSFALGEKMSKEKLARKILRFLPKKFDMKVTATEEAQYISCIKVDELIGSLQTKV